MINSILSLLFQINIFKFVFHFYLRTMFTASIPGNGIAFGNEQDKGKWTVWLWTLMNASWIFVLMFWILIFFSTTNTILQHEALRTATREALNSDSLFMSLVAECQQSASLRETEIQVKLFWINEQCNRKCTTMSGF